MSLTGIVSLFDVGIEDCSVTGEAAAMSLLDEVSLRAERVRVERASGAFPVVLQGTSTWTDSTFVDCSRGPDVTSGAHSFTRLSIRGATEYGLTAGGGVAVVIDSHIADGQGNCVVGWTKGALILRNVTLSNCSAPAKRSYILARIRRGRRRLPGRAAHARARVRGRAQRRAHQRRRRRRHGPAERARPASRRAGRLRLRRPHHLQRPRAAAELLRCGGRVRRRRHVHRGAAAAECRAQRDDRRLRLHGRSEPV